MQFIYVLAGWEGSAANARVLRDALSRPNGLKVPRGKEFLLSTHSSLFIYVYNIFMAINYDFQNVGCYYLVDSGYRNCEGFLALYRR